MEHAGRNTARVAGGLVAVAAILSGAWYFSATPGGELTQAAVKPTVEPVGANAQATDVPAAATSKPVASAPAPAGDDLESLQLRLDALARAYNERDVPGVERAMWQNHAVVRFTGETMYRADLIGQWTREWSDFRNHQLSFVVEQLARDGEAITAVWALTLQAEIVDAQGEPHAMEVTGSQRATYRVQGGAWVLDDPIQYVGFERTLDGDPWPLGENGR